MSKQAFSQIAEGLNEALAVTRDEAKPFRLHVPLEIDIKAIRSKVGMTQKDFASTFGFGIDQLKQWEQGRSRPLDAMRAYLLLIQAQPLEVMNALKDAHLSETAPDDQPKRSSR